MTIALERMRGLPFFEAFEKEGREILAATLEEQAWWDSATVIEQGDHGGGVYFLLNGKVVVKRRLSEGEIVTLATLNPGTVFGILGVLDAVPRAARCIADGNVRCAVMRRADFLDLMNGESSLSLRFQLEVLRCLFHDIRHTNGKLAELAGLPAAEVSLADLEEMFPGLG